MPIKFRCMHCNQRLGIAQRKAGTQVQCPTCLQMVPVPFEVVGQADSAPPEPLAPATAAAALPPFFEQSNFEDILKPPKPERPSPRPTQGPAPSAGPVWAAPLPAAFDVEPLPAHGDSLSGMAGPAGILLTPGRATVLTVVVVLLLGVAFGAGLVVGRWVL